MQIIKSLILFHLYSLKADEIDSLTDATSSISISEKSRSVPLTNSSSAFLSNERSNENLIIMKDEDYSLIDPSLISPMIISKDYNYNPSRFGEIRDSLIEILPENLFKMIEEYDGFAPIKIAHYHVMKKLDPLGERRKDLNIENKNFFTNLDLIVKEKGNKFPKHDIFWPDLGGLVLKTIIHLRQKMIRVPLDDESKRITDAIKSISSIIEEKLLFSVVGHDFDFKTIKGNDFNLNFLNVEFFEYSHNLSGKFIKALEYTYLSLPIIIDREKGEILNFDCNEFKLKFFKNGNPNTDILLTLFMINYDCKGRIIRECLESNTQSFHSVNSIKELIEKIKADINGLKSKGIKHFPNIPFMKYATNLTVKFILSNKKKILIENESDLYWFLRRMKEGGLVERKDIEAIIEFGNDYTQNREIIKDYKKYHGDFSFNPKVDDFIDEYYEFFRSESLK